MRGYAKAGVCEAIRAAGGEIYAITSEPQRLADDAHENWELAFESIGDPHQEIADACAERGWLRIFVNPSVRLLERVGPWVSHPKGYFQPGVLALTREGRVLYRWRGRPTRSNAGGALMRPTADHVWASIRERLGAGSAAADAPHDDAPTLDSQPIPWLLFVTLLTANGWFVSPRGFDQRGRSDSVAGRVRRAALRIPFFVAAWIAAFVFLPSIWVLAALGVWMAAISPRILFIHREFQNVGPEEVPG